MESTFSWKVRKFRIKYRKPLEIGKYEWYTVQELNKMRLDESELRFTLIYVIGVLLFFCCMMICCFMEVCVLSKREEYERRAEELLMPIIEENNYELVDVEYVKEAGSWYLRAYIDKEGGFTIGDCEKVSRAFSDLLDEHDFIEDAYILEVSSPGLGRPLKKEKDYVRSMGKELEIRTYRALDGEKEFYGILTAYDDKTVTIRQEDESLKTFAKNEIALIRLAFDF